MTVFPPINKEENREACRAFVRFIQDATSDGLGTFVAFEYDQWLVVATWNGSGFNDRLRDLVAEHRGKPQVVPGPES